LNRPNLPPCSSAPTNSPPPSPKGLRPLYVIHGDEPLLAQEAADAIRSAARAAGYSERSVHTVAGAHFDWSGLLGEASALSLFADRRVIEIRIPSGKPGKDGSEALQRYVETLSDDNLTLILLPKLDRTQQTSAWFTALDGAGLSIRIDPVERARCRSGSRSGWRRRGCASRTARRGSTRWPSSPTASRATCLPRTRRSASSRCCTPPPIRAARPPC